jgi:hypothetical protein
MYYPSIPLYMTSMYTMYLMCMLTCVCQEKLLNLTINTFLFIILETILCCTIYDVSSNKCIKSFKTGLCHTIVPQIINNCWTLMCRTIQAQIIVSNFINCNVPHHTGTNNCIETLKSVMCYTIQTQIVVSNFKNCNVSHHTGTNNSIKF